MPAVETPPSVDELLDAGAAGVASKNSTADTEDGSRYDIWAGVSAVLTARMAQRARGRFRNIYFDASDDAALDEIVRLRYAEITPRVLATAGVGTATLVRDSAAAGAGTIYAGTRMTHTDGGAAGIRYYTVTEDYPVGATQLVATPDIEAYQAGTGQATSTVQGDRLALEDSVFDPTFVPTRIVCADGTVRERGEDLRPRVRRERRANRIGYETEIETAMRDAGAEEVKFFPSNYFGDAADHGLNRIYVSDLSFSTSDALLSACRLAAFDSIMFGAATQALPLQSQNLTVSLQLTLWSHISFTSRNILIADVRSRAVEYVRANPFVWTVSGIEGAARRASQDISEITATPSVAEPDITVLFNTPPLTRWVLTPANCIVTIG